MADADLYPRGLETLLASWESYTRGSYRAELIRLPRVSAAVFPDEPERGPYGNAVLDRDLRGTERAEAVATEDAYADTGVAPRWDSAISAGTPLPTIGRVCCWLKVSPQPAFQQSAMGSS